MALFLLIIIKKRRGAHGAPYERRILARVSGDINQNKYVRLICAVSSIDQRNTRPLVAASYATENKLVLK